jgi:UDP-N-acetylglucosamine acyltransferase
MNIHETAIVHPEAKLGKNVSIGPYCIVDKDVEIGDNSILRSHVTVEGIVKIGSNTEIFQFAVIGLPPQDLSYKGDPTSVEIGNNTVIREYTSVHRGTMKDAQVTRIGNNCYIMGYCHLAHDCQVSDNVMFVNQVQCAGHVKIGEGARISGDTNITQFVSIGRGAFIGGDTIIDKDIPCHTTAYGNRVKLKGINIIGLRRAGLDKNVISEVVDFYRTMESSTLSPRAFVNHPELMSEFSKNEIVREMAKFISDSEIGIPPFWN